MAIDSTLPARRAVLTMLKAAPGVIALVDADRIYPETVPANLTWPFILYGASSLLPLKASCVDGSQITVAVHAFAKPRTSGGSVVETAADHAARIGAAIARAIDGRRLAILGGHATVRWQGSRLLRDADEADAFHAVVNLGIRCLTA
jgi:hypothetical protein